MKSEGLEIDPTGAADIPQYDLLEEKVMVPNYNQMASRFSETTTPGTFYFESRRSDGITKWDRIRNNRKNLKRIERERKLLKGKKARLKKESHKVRRCIKLRDWFEHKICKDMRKIGIKLELLDEMEDWLGKEFMHLHGLKEKKPPGVLKIKLIQ